MTAVRVEDVIRDDIRAMAAYHVPDASGMVKLDAMENPYGLPDAVRSDIVRAAAHCALNRYPDPAATQLKRELRAALAIPADMGLVLGNGSDELIQMLVMATARPDVAVLGVEPSFVMFRMISAFVRVPYIGVPLARDFALDTEAMLAALTEHRPRLVFIAYPNNPTGNLFDAAALERLIAAAPGLVVIDEAYHAFARRSFLQRISDYPNLLVMRTLSKSGLAGLRLGLLAGGREWLEQVEKVRLPYNVGVLTQLVAGQVLHHQALLEEQAAAIRSERARLFEALEATRGVTPFPSEANFILFRTNDAQAVFEGLKRQAVLVKNLHGSQGALENCLRVTVGTREENDRFLSALRACLGT
jgi:histidinol-phosphate aminotransferase